MARGGCSKCKGEEYKFLITQTLSFICCQSFVPTPWGGVVEHFGRSTYKWWKQARTPAIVETNLQNIASAE
jgi:hypothetical protein